MRSYQQFKQETYFNKLVRHAQLYSMPNNGNNDDLNVFTCLFLETRQDIGIHRADSIIWFQFPNDFELKGMYFSRYRFVPSIDNTKCPEANDSVLVYNSEMLVSLESPNKGDICTDVDIGSIFTKSSRDMYLNSTFTGKIGVGMELYKNSGSHRGILNPPGAPNVTPDPMNPICDQFVDNSGRGIVFLEKEVLKITTTKRTINRSLIQDDVTSKRQLILVGRKL